jgi:ABC-type multidrug transport system fused ATPase/permease subunit
MKARLESGWRRTSTAKNETTKSAFEREKPNSVAGPLRRLERDFLRGYRWDFAICLAGLMLQSVLVLPVPLLQGRILDELLPFAVIDQAARPVPQRSVYVAIATGLAAIVTCHLTRTALSWAVSNRIGRISQEVVVKLRAALHQKLMRLPMAYFDAQQTGRLMARVTSDVGSILSFVNGGLLQLINDLILAVGIAGVLVYLQWRLAIIALIVLPAYLINQKLFSKKIRELSQAIRSQVASIYALLSERVSAVRVVRGCAREDSELAELDSRIERHRDLSWQNTRVGSRLSLIASFITGAGTIGVLIGGVTLVGQNRLTMGELLAFYSLIGQLYGPIVRLTQFQATAQSTAVSIERLCEVFDEPETIADKPDAMPIVDPEGSLQVENVHFRYGDDRSKLVIDGISMAIEQGSVVGIIGPSGAGKSTLLALMARLYDIPANEIGRILFDDHDIRDWKLADLRSTVALVPQQSLLFEGTIRSNLTYARPEATEDEMKSALEVADLKSTIDNLPHGLETPVGERGVTLSGGQRQRLALARAVVANPKVLLLDDCTSALDAQTESRIQESLKSNLMGRTCVIVSQKISSVRNADRIFVIDGGRILEQGQHDDLIRQGGWYAETYDAQTSALTLALSEN